MVRQKRDRCVFTIMNNEYEFFPIWLNYYSKFFEPQDIYVLDHNSDGEFFEQVQQLSREGKFNLQRVYNYALFDHDWLRNTVTDYQHFLINSYNSLQYSSISLGGSLGSKKSLWKHLPNNSTTYSLEINLIKFLL